MSTADQNAQARAERLVNGMLSRDGFSSWLGIEILEIRPAAAILRMTVRKDMLNGFGVKAQVLVAVRVAARLEPRPPGVGRGLLREGARGELPTTANRSDKEIEEGAPR